MTPAITLMGCRIDNLSMEETLARIGEFIRAGQPHQHVVVNVDGIEPRHVPPLFDRRHGLHLAVHQGHGPSAEVRQRQSK
jgi:hypothetical protein